jgi:bifunctional UDP-N-acetylglucosamine pyrophosphorylase/glucosamine-1-phosphate N-acetyltransferase
MEIVILAAGKGTRMHSDAPKVMHQVGGKPMLERVLDTACSLNPDKIHVVIGFGGEQVRSAFTDHAAGEKIHWVEQKEQLGTGHAVAQALPEIDTKAQSNPVLVLFGDVPLITAASMERVLNNCADDSMSLLTVHAADPAGLGRIIRTASNNVCAIVEERDANEEQRQINEVNSGIMAIPAVRLADWLDAVENNNDQNEYYLTDIVELAVTEKCQVIATVLDDEIEVMGVNNKNQLAIVERHFQMTRAEHLMADGVTVRDPARLDIRGEVTCGKDVEIDINVILEGTVSIGDNSLIGANCVIKDAIIGANVKILPGSNIENAKIGDGSSVGPMARLRPGTVLGEETKIGNFVETKNAVIGNGSKASHLAYLGDVELGENCNIGAGTIVCNYDGVNKHKTVLGNNVFVGSNSVLVAPVTLEDNAFVAAGSAVNSTVPQDNLAVARSKQRNISGWKRPVKKQRD